LKKTKTITNLGASIRAKLYNIARKTERDFDSLLLQYFQERFLYRLSISQFRRNFILKGALLFLAYKMPLLRPTKDIDFLSRALSNDQEKIKSIIGQVASINAMDGVSFVIESITAERIIENADYGGIRVKIEAMLDNARKALQLDIGFGDTIVAGPIEMDFPILLEEQPVPHLQVYSKESAVAEKFEALVKLNILSSRMKDVYDILFLAAHESFNLKTMQEAILETFRNRATQIEGRMSIFAEEFKQSKEKQTQWSAFLRRSHLDSYKGFAEAVEHLEQFIEPTCSRRLSSKHDTRWQPEVWKWQ
jgi:predicted nucleotidyltransferase component of viral defense system